MLFSTGSVLSRGRGLHQAVLLVSLPELSLCECWVQEKSWAGRTQPRHASPCVCLMSAGLCYAVQQGQLYFPGGLTFRNESLAGKNVRQAFWPSLNHVPQHSFISNKGGTLATWCEALTHWKRPWCWERLKAGGEGDDRGWDDWMASPTWWTWVWASSGSWWWTGKPGMLQPMRSQRVGHN